LVCRQDAGSTLRFMEKFTENQSVRQKTVSFRQEVSEGNTRGSA
jgi:hypothetical protein